MKYFQEKSATVTSETARPVRSNEPTRPAHSYPLRQLPRKNYMDLEAPDDDDFLCKNDLLAPSIFVFNLSVTVITFVLSMCL